MTLTILTILGCLGCILVGYMIGRQDAKHDSMKRRPTGLMVIPPDALLAMVEQAEQRSREEEIDELERQWDQDRHGK